eukprot:scaffold2220_cov377-Prasinococcus_capsulatus_cf.AAC.2
MPCATCPATCFACGGSDGRFDSSDRRAAYGPGKTFPPGALVLRLTLPPQSATSCALHDGIGHCLPL